jgi:hypothetical protein
MQSDGYVAVFFTKAILGMKMKYVCVTLFATLFVILNHFVCAQPAPFGKADTLYFNSRWDEARLQYESGFKARPASVNALSEFRLGYCYHRLNKYASALDHYNRSKALKPVPQLKAQLYARIARVESIQNHKDNAMVSLDSAIRFGYASLNEMDTLKEFQNLRTDKRFEERHKRVYNAAYPCASNPRMREFDFWIGEWDVYVTGTTTPKIGHSLIQNVAGECLILENWTALGPVPNTGKSMNYFDTVSQAWEQVWMGSGGGLNKFVKGKYEDGAMRFIFTQPNPGGKPLQGRFTFFNLGPDKVRQFKETSTDDGNTWQAVYDFTYIRRAP